MRSNRFWHIVFSCQRAFVLPPCPAEWPATNSLRLAYAPRLSTPHYSVICIFHTLPQTPLFPASTLAISAPPIVAIAECEEGFLAALGMTEREEDQKERCRTPQTPFGMTNAFRMSARRHCEEVEEAENGDFGGTPTPLFGLCRGNKGVTGIWTLSRGKKGLSSTGESPVGRGERNVGSTASKWPLRDAHPGGMLDISKSVGRVAHSQCSLAILNR